MTAISVPLPPIDQTAGLNSSLTSPPVRLRSDDNGIVLTPDEFDGISDSDEEWNFELIHGVVIVTPIPSPAERDPNGELELILRDYQRKSPGILDKTLFEEYVRTGDSRRRADRVIWAGLGRIPDPKTDVPAIVIEFVSASRRDQVRDYIVKRDEYLAIGVKEYWVIDRFRRALTVFRAGAGNEAAVVVLENDTYRTPLLPGFELPLKSLLRVADDWK